MSARSYFELQTPITDKKLDFLIDVAYSLGEVIFEVDDNIYVVKVEELKEQE